MGVVLHAEQCFCDINFKFFAIFRRDNKWIFTVATTFGGFLFTFATTVATTFGGFLFTFATIVAFVCVKWVTLAAAASFHIITRFPFNFL